MNQDKSKVIKVIWGALVYSQLMYGVVIYLTQREYLDAPFATDHPMFMNTVVMAVAAFAAAIFIPASLLETAKRKMKDQASGGGQTNYVAAYFTPWIVRMALFEAVTIFGLTFVFQSHIPVAFVPFAVVGLLGQVSQFPSEQRIKDAVGV